MQAGVRLISCQVQETGQPLQNPGRIVEQVFVACGENGVQLSPGFPFGNNPLTKAIAEIYLDQLSERVLATTCPQFPAVFIGRDHHVTGITVRKVAFTMPVLVR